VPLVVGRRRLLPDGGRHEHPMRIELAVLGWDIRAGSLRGPGDFGSRIRLAWRSADRSVELFSTPPVVPHILPRLPVAFRMQSVLGLKLPKVLARFQTKKGIR
jgi:hypothetical protein